jgi:hypothetical protein
LDGQGFAMTERVDEVILSVRVPTDLREAIERAAEREHRTVSGQTRFLLASALEQRSQPRAGA